jgi:hypothetical protein
VQFGPCVCELARLASFEEFGEDGIAVKTIEYHNRVITARGLHWEFSCLVRVGLA